MGFHTAQGKGEGKGRGKGKGNGKGKGKGKGKGEGEGKGKGKGKGKGNGKGKGKDKAKGKGKATAKGKGKGKGKSQKIAREGKGNQGKGLKPIDDFASLSQGVKDFHAALISCVPQQLRLEERWKHEFLKYYDLTDENRIEFCSKISDHMKDLGKGKNKRLYIGPGKEDNADDKIAVDRKINPKNTKADCNKSCKERGYKKTFFGLFSVTDEDGKKRDVWTLIECQVDLDMTLDLEKSVKLMEHLDISTKR